MRHIYVYLYMNVKVTKITTYNPGEALFDSWRRNIRGDWGAVAGVLTSNLRLNIGDAAMALFCRANEGTLLGLLIMILIVRVCVSVCICHGLHDETRMCLCEWVHICEREREKEDLHQGINISLRINFAHGRWWWKIPSMKSIENLINFKIKLFLTFELKN